MVCTSILKFCLLSTCIIAQLAILGCGGGNQSEPVVPVEEAVVIGPAPKLDFGAGTKPILLQTEELKDRLKGGKSNRPLSEVVVLLDARPKEEFEKGHIPKARHVDVEEWKKQASTAAGLQDSAAWSDLLGKAGLVRVPYIVVYSDQPQEAARVWWTLKYLGMANAAILDGGWKGWVDSRGDVTTEVVEIDPIKSPIEFQPDRLSLMTDLKTAHASGDVKVVDARSQDEFSKGRIPGSVRIEWSELLGPDGRFKSVEELKAVFKERGLDESKTTVTYCQAGGRSSLDAFALELAGFGKVKNYYCSWQEWSGDASAPQEK